MYYSIPYTDFKTQKDGVCLRFHLSSMKRLKIEAENRGISFTVTKKSGIPHFLAKYRYRFGIFIGIILSALLVFASQKFLWRIDVIGNESLTTSEIRELLEGYGFSIGCYIPSVNTDRIENRILIDSDEISWISLNITGNTAEVQVRERQKKNESVKTSPANLVAAKSGVVEEVRVFRGLVVANAGKFVNKGDLLVSGIYDSTQVGFRYTRASGKVMARTLSEYCIEIPLEYEGIRYTGEEYYDKYLNFFDYSINISKNYGKVGALYDKIDIVENCCYADGTPTPFEIHTVKYMEYERITVRRSAEEAEDMAYFELSQKLAEMAEDTVILKKTVTPMLREDSYMLFCTVVAVENIAEISEFEVGEVEFVMP